MRWHLLKCHRRQGLDPDRLASSSPALVFKCAFDMIGRNLPGAVGLPLNRARRSPDRFQAPDVRLHEPVGRGRIMAEMDVFAVAAAIGGGDLGDGPVDVADRDWRWTDPYNCAFATMLIATKADLYVVGTPVDGVDDQILAPDLLVR
jgi:hypothetical protein